MESKKLMREKDKDSWIKAKKDTLMVVHNRKEVFNSQTHQMVMLLIQEWMIIQKLVDHSCLTLAHICMLIETMLIK